jgi:insulysin
LSHLLGDESENSLLGFLKTEGLAMSLTSDSTHEIGAFSYISVTIVLTQKGLQDVDIVIAAVFKYTQAINQLGPS